MKKHQVLGAVVLIGLLVVALPAWAGPGWYLLAPWFDLSGSRYPATDRPWSEWEQIRAFDSATECKRFRHAWIKDPSIAFTSSELPKEMLVEVLQPRAAASICVISTDPRLIPPSRR